MSRRTTIRYPWIALGIVIAGAASLGALNASDFEAPRAGYALRPDATLGISPVVDPVVSLPTAAPDEPIPPGAFQHGPPAGTFIDLDLQPHGRHVENWFDDDAWDCQFLPSSIIYKAYLAGEKESRFSSQHVYNRHDGWLWEPTLGARVGVVRYGNHDPVMPQGWQVDVEGSAQGRLVIPENVDVRSVDFRAGVLLTRGVGPWRTKFGYYHLSSHLGDEFLLANPGYPRLNFARDGFVLGQAFYVTSALRVYAEAAWAFYTDVSEPWEFQFGVDYAPALPTGVAGAPFFAINGHLRQEVDFGGNLVVQTGWAWRNQDGGRLLRFGMTYYNGKSSQYSFYQLSEQQIGLGVWYDY